MIYNHYQFKLCRQKLLFAGILIFSLLFSGNYALASTTIGANISTNGNLSVDGTRLLPSGASNNYILKTDASGNAVWYSVASVLSNATTDDLPQGVTNLYYDGADVNTRADNRITLQKGNASGLASLDSGGKIPSSQIPTLAISNTYVVADQAARLALSANVGDVSVQTDTSKTYILQATPASSPSNWVQSLHRPKSYLSMAERGQCHRKRGIILRLTLA